MNDSIKKRPIAAEIPVELQDADELLTRYGRSVMDRWHKQHCASAEGQYVAPPNEDDRLPRETLLEGVDLALVQRALIAVPDRERQILQILYIPKRLPAQAQLRMLRIPPELACSRHLDGLRCFAARHRAEIVMVERARSGLRRAVRHSRIVEALAMGIEKVESGA
jgi:hypothetical protein